MFWTIVAIAALAMLAQWVFNPYKPPDERPPDEKKGDTDD